MAPGHKPGFVSELLGEHKLSKGFQREWELGLPGIQIQIHHFALCDLW